MSGNVKHIGFRLNSKRPIDSKCIDILSNLPNGESACSYIRKAIIFYNKNNGTVPETGSDAMDKLDLILSKLDSLGGLPNKADTPEPEEVKKPKNSKKKKNEEIKYVIPEDLDNKEEEPEEEQEDNTLSVDANSDIDDDNFDELMGDFLG